MDTESNNLDKKSRQEMKKDQKNGDSSIFINNSTERGDILASKVYKILLLPNYSMKFSIDNNVYLIYVGIRIKSGNIISGISNSERINSGIHKNRNA